jgi:hypothetical protein
LNKKLALCAALLIGVSGTSVAQPRPCPPAGWTIAQLDALKADKFTIADARRRQALALALTACLGNPDASIRDGIAFEGLSAFMRANALDRATLTAIKSELRATIAGPDPSGLQRPFAALVLSEVARTDRVSAWMSDGERDELVTGASQFLSNITDYRAFSNAEGFRHGVAHGADFAMQLALNPAVAKPQLDRLLAAIATQIAPKDPQVAYWAGEPDRLARAVLVIAQRKLHSDNEWNAWFTALMNPAPLRSWDVAFNTESGIRKHHNVRAFLLSIFATASTGEDSGLKQLISPVRNALKLVP